ncbi:WYL domain-containing protein [Anaerocolumna sp. AGMB13020]|uniref:WYL domain-containing protein n=1 Tax=Anaerocolumna sp. AGMB13020 TaxID=3081750 RepID=UPI0029549928|nr:WYL domain-containing protein [Anaerocolumna sp. AGMB13020]WOO39079.1 WYL domain-containing protein [Anaerocolumna sp. AGMB13020]
MKINNHLFSEVYGCYFTVVKRILEQAEGGLTQAEIESMVQADGFYDSAFHLLPKLFSGEWNLMEHRTDGKYYSRLLSNNLTRPMTDLERAWLKALLTDKRIQLFIDPEEAAALKEVLNEIPPLFLPSDFHFYDSAADGDSYEEKRYIDNFRLILKACESQTPLSILYESGKQNRTRRFVIPYKLNYSSRDDKFRLLGVTCQKGGHFKKITLNLTRILTVEPSADTYSENTEINSTKTFPVACAGALTETSANIKSPFPFYQFFRETKCKEPIVLEISKERNGLERCMLQFASWEKQTEYDEAHDCYVCRIYYDGQDETELLVRVLSFGPVVKVLGPTSFLTQIKERVRNQYRLNTWEEP